MIEGRITIKSITTLKSQIKNNINQEKAHVNETVRYKPTVTINMLISKIKKQKQDLCAATVVPLLILSC